MLRDKGILLVGAAALLPLVAGQVVAQPSEQASRPFAPPEAPQVLTRTVWRTLADGKEIMVRRRYTVRFTRQGDGFLLDGHLLDAAVEAPPILAAMADLERGRRDDELFPLLLDAGGRIRADPTVRRGSLALHDSARQQAQELLAVKPLADPQRQVSVAFLTQLATQGAMTAWPADLFNSAAGERHEHRRIVLPGGQEGEVNVSLKVVQPRPEGPQLAVERTITTILAGTSRTSRERWTLASSDHPEF